MVQPMREDRVGCLWVPTFIVVAALLIWGLGCVPVQASTDCPDPTRPIHYPPLCLTETEYAALTAPPPAPTPVAAVYGPLVERWRPLVVFYWPPWAVDRMMRIMRCESLGDPTARNPSSGASGLFQIMPGWKKIWGGDYFDPWINTATAYQIWLVQGFDAWVCR
jgi:hypothetical protein